MIIDKLGKTVYISITDVPVLLMGFTCPIDGRIIKCNGTGPVNKPLLTKALHVLPSEHIIGGLSACAHDLAYMLCPSGWAVHVTYDGNGYTAIDKDSADLMYSDLMHAQVEHRAAYGTKWWYHQCADRNYTAVHLGGNSSYKHQH